MSSRAVSPMSPPSASANDRTIHCGWLYASARCPTGSVSCAGASFATQASASRLVISRSTALANPVAPGPTGPDQVDGGRHRGVRGHPHVQDLVRPEPQRVAHRRVDALHVPPGRVGDDRVERAGVPQRAVGQLGGERGVPAGQPGLAQHRREHQVGVRVVAVHRGDRLVRDLPGQVHGRTGRTTRTPPVAAEPVTAAPVRTGPVAALAVGPRSTIAVLHGAYPR